MKLAITLAIWLFLLGIAEARLGDLFATGNSFPEVYARTGSSDNNPSGSLSHQTFFSQTETYSSLISVTPTITPTPTFTPSPTLTPTPTPSPTIYEQKSRKPYILEIDKINIKAPVIEQGENSEGEMSVPPDNKTVGWWMKGTRPGDVGSAVFAGHYKMDDGSPGIFYRLNNLQVGDEMRIITDDLHSKIFVVTKIEVYKVSDFPLDYVFANKDGRKLNLITCAGKYVKETDDYTQRLVIYSELREES